MSEEKLKEYFLEEERFNEFSDFFGYRVLGTFQFSPKYGTLISSGIKIFKTESIAWVEEFRIGIIQNIGDYLVIVSPECPEVYFTMPEEIIDKIKDIYNAGDYINLDSETLQKLMEELNDANRKWTTNPTMTDSGIIWYDSSSANPFVPYSQVSTTTCSSVVSSASGISTNINPNNTNTYVTGYNI
jgi:hypothetical protein